VTELAVFAAVVLAYALVSRPIAGTIVTAPLVFAAAGMVAGPQMLGLANANVTEGAGLLVAELALAFVLFADASRIDLASLRSHQAVPARLLAIGMPLTIALGVAAGALLLTEIEFWEAAIVAAVLAPTDAALGQPLFSSRQVPRRIREALSVESGLNDGLSVPFLALFVALAVDQADVSGRSWVRFAVEQIGYGALIGASVGAIGAWLVGRAHRRELMTGPFERLAVIALAALAFVLAAEAGGNGFIAAFVGGLAAGRITNVCGERILAFLEGEGQLLSLAVFFILGVTSLELLESAGWEVGAYAVMSLTVVRMLPVAIATVRTGLSARSVAFMGWFGPRGLASVVLVLTVAEEQPELPALDVVLAATTVTVLASILLHAVTAPSLVRAYGSVRT
jgi:NhaP-type Na+/H+ or K+/H+ antiporter